MMNTNFLGKACGNMSTSFPNRRLEFLYCFLYWKTLRKYQNIDILSLDLFVVKSEFFAPVFPFHLFEILHQICSEVASCMYQWGGRLERSLLVVKA